MKHEKRRAISSWALRLIFQSHQLQGRFLCVLFMTVIIGTRSWKNTECHQNILEDKSQKKKKKKFNPKTCPSLTLTFEPE